MRTTNIIFKIDQRAKIFSRNFLFYFSLFIDESNGNGARKGWGEKQSTC